MASRNNTGGSRTPSFRAGNISTPVRGLGKIRVRDDVDDISAPHTVTEDYKDSRDASRMARSYAESVGFDNLATDKEIETTAKYACMANRRSLFHHLEYLRNKWLILYRLYRGESINEFSYGRLQQHSPEPFKGVETAHPRIMRTLFGQQRWFRLTGIEKEHDKNADAQEALIRDQLRDTNFKAKTEKFVRDALIYGTAIQKCYWKQEVDEVMFREARKVPSKRLSTATEIELEEERREELVFDGNNIENVEIFDFMISPSANSIEEADWCADRRLMSAMEVQKMGELGYWKNLDQLEDRPGVNDPTFGDEFKERKSYSYGVFDPREAAETPHIPYYTVEDWYIPIDLKEENGRFETKLCNVVVIDPDGLNVIARVTELPFWHRQKPYQAFRPISLTNEFYGIGIIEMIARMSRELDMKRNLHMAATQLEANPMWLLSDAANVPDGQLTIAPGHTIRVPDIQNSIAPLHVPKVSSAALEAENVLKMDIRETMGTTSPSMGANSPSGGSKTATQHTSEIDQTNMRISNMIFNYEEQVVKPMIHQMCWNNQQFQSYRKVVRDYGAVGVGFKDRYIVSPEDLLGRFIVEPLASFRVTTKQTQVQQLVNLLDRAMPINQMYGPDTIDIPGLLAHIMEFGFEMRDVDDFIQSRDMKHLVTDLQEHELWYHGNVPPVREKDNHLRMFIGHMEELKTPRFQQLEREDPRLAADIRAHIAEHGYKIAWTKDRQELAVMEAMQEAIRQNIMPPGLDGMQAQGMALGGRPEQPGNIEGVGSPDQSPESPNFRRNETTRSAEQNAPNPGQQ